MPMFGHVWTCLDMFGHVWTCLDMFGHAWTCLDMFGHVWTCLDMFDSFFGGIHQTPQECNVTYIFQVGKSDLVIFYSNHPKNVTNIFEVYLYKFDL